MKKVRPIAVLLVILVVGGYFLFVPSINKLNSCVEDYNQSLMEKMTSAREGQFGRKQLCVNNVEPLQNFSDCYKAAEAGSVLPTNVLMSIGSLMSDLPQEITPENLKMLHNESCAEFTDTLVGQ